MSSSLSCFNKILKYVSVSIGALNSIKIVLGLFSAQMIAKVVTAATSGEVERVISYSILLLVVLVVYHLFYTVVSAATQRRSATLEHQCKMLLYKKFLNQPLSVLYNLNKGESIEKLNDDFHTVASVSLSLYPSFIVSVLTVMVYLAYFVGSSTLVALTLLIISMIQVIPPIIVKRYMENIYEMNRDIEAQETDFIISGYNGLAEIKLFNLKSWYMNKLQLLNKQSIKIGTLHQVFFQSEIAMEHMMESLLKYGTYGVLGLFVLQHDVSLEIAISVMALSGSFYGAVQSIFGLLPDFGVAKVAQSRLDVWFKEPIYLEPSKSSNRIILDKVSFNYGDTQILSKVSKHILLDKITLIYGGNGSGKSTLMKCLVGLIPIDSGKLSIDGISPVHLSHTYFNKHILYLPQEDAPLRMTGSELFQLIDRDKIEACKKNARAFGLTEDLLTQQLISDLSGGERKKVYLSMAFAMPRKLILLDEPTNSLDDLGKSVLMDKLKERGKGVILITHDPELKGLGDEICFCEGGGLGYECL